jgi:presenilin-like A22 family membrane protease
MLVVSALRFLKDPEVPISLGQLLTNLPALGAALGTLAGFGVLMTFVLRGNPQAGLPLLNGGAITGFLLGLYWMEGNLNALKFW